jgi:hypothetical protein
MGLVASAPRKSETCCFRCCRGVDVDVDDCGPADPASSCCREGVVTTAPSVNSKSLLAVMDTDSSGQEILGLPLPSAISVSPLVVSFHHHGSGMGRLSCWVAAHCNATTHVCASSRLLTAHRKSRCSLTAGSGCRHEARVTADSDRGE